jgi:hypothetical protein
MHVSLALTLHSHFLIQLRPQHTGSVDGDIMSICSYCQRIPAKLFSYARDTQCTIDHQPSYLALEESSASGCPLCKLFIHAIKVYYREPLIYASPKKWEDSEPVRISSTKFGKQLVRVGWAEAGLFRGIEIPSDWSSLSLFSLVMQASED